MPENVRAHTIRRLSGVERSSPVGLGQGLRSRSAVAPYPRPVGGTGERGDGPTNAGSARDTQVAGVYRTVAHPGGVRDSIAGRYSAFVGGPGLSASGAACTPAPGPLPSRRHFPQHWTRYWRCRASGLTPPAPCWRLPSSATLRWWTPTRHVCWLGGTAAGWGRPRCNWRLTARCRPGRDGRGIKRCWIWGPRCARCGHQPVNAAR